MLQLPWQWCIHEAPHDFYRYTPYGLKYMFDKAGFLDVVVEPQAVFGAIWYLDQKAAPHLDKLDKNWAAAATGYFVTARKP